MSIADVPRLSSGNNLKIGLLIFCGVCLVISLLFATYGVDLSPGFF